MSENLEKKEIDMDSSKTRQDPNIQSSGDETFDAIMASIKEKIEKDHKQEQRLSNPKLSEDLHKESIKEAERRQEENKKQFERRSNNFAKLQALRSEFQRSPEEQQEDAREESRRAAQEAIEKQMKQDLSERQKMIIRVAGDHALDVLYRVAARLEEQAERGGAGAFLIITLTYLIALAKDISDIGHGGLVGIFTGIIASAFLAFFWSLACGGWHGGAITNQIIKRVLRKILLATAVDGIPVIGIVPTYLIINLWCHMDFKRGISRTEDEIIETDEKIKTTRENVEIQANNVDSSL